MNRFENLRPLPLAAAAALFVAAQSGCTSALTTAYLRDGLWDSSEHSAEAEAPAAATADTDSPAPEPSEASVAADRERREAALEEAMARLARLGPLDAAVEAAIVASLQKTEPEDWPVVVEEFAASLAAAPGAAPTETPASLAPAPAAAPVTPEPTSPDAVATEAVSADAIVDTAPAATPAQPDPAEPDPAAPAEPQAAPERPALAVRNACFASAVRGWGDVVRFPADRFAAGQEVIVYVELDNLEANASPAGQTTCIDAVLRLVDDAGQPLHAWNFDPIAETRTAPRRDYFARWVVRMPDALPGGACRVELEVTDTLGAATATAALPLEITAD